MKAAHPPPPLHDRYSREFDDWVYCCRGDEGIAELIAAYDTWIIGAALAVTECRISHRQRAAARDKAIALLMVRESPEIVVGKVVWRTDGKRLYASMA